jgi:enoyl-CoA hydratase/carnithine racemase
MELMCKAEIIGTEEGQKMGFVSRIVPDKTLMPEAGNVTREIACQAPVTIELTKKVVWQERFDELNRQMDLESWAQQICFGTDDH